MSQISAESSVRRDAPPRSRIALGLHVMVAGLAAGLVVGGLDVVIAIARTEASLDLIDAFAAVQVVAVLDATLGLGVGALLGMFVATMVGWSRLEGWRERCVRLLEALQRNTDPTPGRTARTLLGLTTGIALAAGTTFAATRVLLPSVGWDRWMALPVGLIVALVVVAGPRLVAGWASLVGRATRSMSPRAAVAVLAALVGVAALISYAPLVRLGRAVDLWMPALLAILVGGTLVLTLVALGGRPRWIAGALFLVLGWIATIAGTGDRDGVVAVVRGSSSLASLAAETAARLTDFDGDGSSAWFGDGDCEPFDARRSPAAIEVPGNGIDDDCFDGDAVATIDPPRGALTPLPSTIPDDLSFIVIVVDAVRRDHVQFYGYDRPTTPNLAKLATRSIVFDRAYSPSSYTIPSVSAIMTSRYPSSIPGALTKKSQLTEKDEPIATVMARAGLSTAYVNDYPAHVRSAGFAQGFQAVENLSDNAIATVDRALAWLDTHRTERFFLWVSLLAPHDPYDVHAGVPRFGTRYEDIYDHEIAYADREIGRLLDRIEQLGLGDRVAITFISDHGEAFGEHGTYFHGHNLHDENVRVPWLLYVPGLNPRVIREPVSLLDVFPTLLRLARIPIPPRARGVELTGALAGDAVPPHPVLIESQFSGYGVKQGSQAALVEGPYKLIEERRRWSRLYDLAADPGETRDISRQRPDLTHRLRRALRAAQAQGKLER